MVDSVCSKLASLVPQFSALSLRRSSDFATELLFSLLPDSASAYSITLPPGPSLSLPAARAASLISNGAFIRAFNTVKYSLSIPSVSPSRPVSIDIHALFLAIHSLLLFHSQNSLSDDRIPSLLVLSQQLSSLSSSISSQLDPFCWWAFGSVFSRANNVNAARTALLTALSKEPFLFGAWDDLLSTCSSFADAEQCAESVVSSAGSTAALPFRIFLARAAGHFRVEHCGCRRWESLCSDFPRWERARGELLKARQMAGSSASKSKDLAKSLDTFRTEFSGVVSNVWFVGKDTGMLAQVARDAHLASPHSPETLVAIGNLHSMTGNTEEALKCFKAASKIDRKSDESLILLGQEYMKSNNAPKAISCFREAAERDERDYRAWYGLAEGYLLLGQFLLAMNYAQKACSLRPNEWKMWDCLSKCYLQVGNRKMALHSELRAFFIVPNNSGVCRCISKLFEEEKEMRLSGLFGKMGLDTDVKSEEVVDVMIAVALYEKEEGRKDECVSMCQKVIEIGNRQQKEKATEILQIIQNRTMF